MLVHPNAISTWPTVRVDRGSLQTIYVVETDLALSPDDPAYDKEAYDSLVEAARAYLEANPSYDSVQIDRIKKP